MQVDLDTKFQRRQLDADNHIYTGWLPNELIPDADLLEQIIAMRPIEQQFVQVRGLVAIPKRQAAYGADYAFSGIVLKAVPTPPILKVFRDWAREEIDPRMNGLLLNWYDGPDEYIGDHNDEDKDLFAGSPIITIAFGEERKLRMRPNEGPGYKDFSFPHGSFILIPYSTNLHWKHEVPESRKYRGRRVSITGRCFSRGVVDVD
jgi:alkylated DNA repair dioxygenase AlkB